MGRTDDRQPDDTAGTGTTPAPRVARAVPNHGACGSCHNSRTPADAPTGTVRGTQRGSWCRSHSLCSLRGSRAPSSRAVNGTTCTPSCPRAADDAKASEDWRFVSGGTSRTPRLGGHLQHRILYRMHFVTGSAGHIVRGVSAQRPVMCCIRLVTTQTHRILLHDGNAGLDAEIDYSRRAAGLWLSRGHRPGHGRPRTAARHDRTARADHSRGRAWCERVPGSTDRHGSRGRCRRPSGCMPVQASLARLPRPAMPHISDMTPPRRA